MANDYKQLAAKRLEEFRNECKERGVTSLSTTENVRLKTVFLNDLSTKYGRDILGITFDDLLSDLMGSGINPIEQYIQSLSSEFPFLGEELPAEEQAGTPPEDTAAPAADEEDVEDGGKDKVSGSLNSGQKQERQTRTRKKSASGSDIFWTPASSAMANTRKVRELRNKISVIAKDRDILHRQFSIYRQDYAIIQGLLEYGKKGNTPLEYNGLSLDNQQNVIHAALENLIKDLQSSGKTECFQNIKKYREMAEDEAAFSNEKIAKLEKELQKLLGQ